MELRKNIFHGALAILAVNFIFNRSISMPYETEMQRLFKQIKTLELEVSEFEESFERADFLNVDLGFEKYLGKAKRLSTLENLYLMNETKRDKYFSRAFVYGYFTD